MKIDTIHFNLELIIGESCAILFAALFGFLASLIYSTPYFISTLSSIGAILSSGIVWIFLRIKNAQVRKEYYRGKVLSDIASYTPFATAINILIYQPVAFLISSSLIRKSSKIIYPLIIGQFFGFLIFVVIINLYRLLLAKFTGKRI